MKFSFIAEKAELGVARLCRVLAVSRAGYYAWCLRPQSAHDVEDERLKVLVHEAHLLGRKAYGSPRVHRALKKKGEHVSRKRVVRLMQEEALVGRPRRRFKHTTDSEHGLPVAGNLLDRQFTASAPNQRWVGDTTELLTPSGKLYLAAIIDLFSRFVVGWAVSAVNDRHLTIKALDAALRRRCPGAGLLHHSDQGSTYASEDYQDILERRGITCSMSRRGNCYDNAAMESWNSTLKSELGEHFASPADAKEKLFDFIEVFYNQTRMHSSLDYASAGRVRARSAAGTARGMSTTVSQRISTSTASTERSRPLAGHRNDERISTQASGAPDSSVCVSTSSSTPSLAALASAGVATDNNQPRRSRTDYPEHDDDDGVFRRINTVHEIGSGPGPSVLRQATREGLVQLGRRTVRPLRSTACRRRSSELMEWGRLSAARMTHARFPSFHSSAPAFDRWTPGTEWWSRARLRLSAREGARRTEGRGVPAQCASRTGALPVRRALVTIRSTRGKKRRFR